MRLELGLRFEDYIKGFKSLIKTDYTTTLGQAKNHKFSVLHGTRHSPHMF